MCDEDACGCGCAGTGRALSATNPPGHNENPLVAPHCPWGCPGPAGRSTPSLGGLPSPSPAQGYIKAGKNWVLGWMARNFGHGAGKEDCQSLAGLWPPGLCVIPGFCELPEFITNSLRTAKALPGSLCCFKLQSKKRGYKLMERCQESPRRANPRQNLPVHELMGCSESSPERQAGKQPPGTTGWGSPGRTGRTRQVSDKTDPWGGFTQVG